MATGRAADAAQAQDRDDERNRRGGRDRLRHRQRPPHRHPPRRALLAHDGTGAVAVARRHRQRRAQARAEPGTETARTLANVGSRPSHPLGRSRADQEDLRRHQHGSAGPLRRSRSRSGREDEHDVPESSRRQRHGDRGHPHPGAVRRSAAHRTRRSSCRPRSSTSPGSDAARTSRIPIASAAPRSVGTTRP